MKQIDTIFIIDDDRLSNFLVEKIIRHLLPFVTIQSYIKPRFALITLEEIIEKKEKFPDVIFLDLNMPVLNGWDFLKELQKFPKQALANCKIYILSSSIIESDIARSRSFTIISDFISKPLSHEKLSEIFEIQLH